jgi:hypothetical protein
MLDCWLGSTNDGPAVKAWAEGRMIHVELHDGRTLGFPADRFRRLAAASELQLAAVRIELDGYALRKFSSWEPGEEGDGLVTGDGDGVALAGGRPFFLNRSPTLFSIDVR